MIPDLIMDITSQKRQCEWQFVHSGATIFLMYLLLSGILCCFPISGCHRIILHTSHTNHTIAFKLNVPYGMHMWVSKGIQISFKTLATTIHNLISLQKSWNLYTGTLKNTTTCCTFQLIFAISGLYANFAPSQRNYQRILSYVLLVILLLKLCTLKKTCFMISKIQR